MNFNNIADHYRRFRVQDRLLFTGHSHQAWPDVALEGIVESFNVAAGSVDRKWGNAFEKAARVRRGFASWLGLSAESERQFALTQNTLEGLTRLISALQGTRGPRREIVTTDGEFHTARRLFDRLAEDGWKIVRVSSLPAHSVGERLAEAIHENTFACFFSLVFFDSGCVAGQVSQVTRKARHLGVPVIVDVYHALGPIVVRLDDWDLQDAFVVGGGYKYLQLGEGCCFLRVPAGCDLRPRETGWFAEFSELTRQSGVGFGKEGQRFAGATYDPISHFRAARVMDFFQDMGWSPEVLSASYRRQIERFQLWESTVLPKYTEKWGIEPPLGRPPETLAGFWAIRSPHVGEWCAELENQGVDTDFRGTTLRFGPAPYHSDGQIDRALAIFEGILAEK